jgi:UDP-N-acetylmuramyl tripeptide synthase
MTERHVLVVFHEGHWKVSFAGTDQGPYSSREAAVEQAIEMAKTVAESGVETEVRVQNENREFTTAWRPEKG